MQRLKDLSQQAFTISAGGRTATCVRASIGTVFFSWHSMGGWTFLLFVLLAIMLLAALYLLAKTTEMRRLAKWPERKYDKTRMEEFISSLDRQQIDGYLSSEKCAGQPGGSDGRQREGGDGCQPGDSDGRQWEGSGGGNGQSQAHGSRRSGSTLPPLLLLFAALFLCNLTSLAQAPAPATPSLLTHPGILILLTLLLLPVVAGVILMIVKIRSTVSQYRYKKAMEESAQFDAYLDQLGGSEASAVLLRRQRALDYRLSNKELAGYTRPEDNRGLLQQVNSHADLTVIPVKKRAAERPMVDPALSRLVLWYLGCATFWLLFGTTVGEYMGIKFVAPDVDHQSWLSFGRIRPVHTNAVFWGWASLAMLGLGHYILPRVSNVPLASIKRGWHSLILINIAIVLGSLCLMGGINNGGGEYREYIWPVMLIWIIGLVLVLINFIRTVAKRTTREIYISSWYIIAAVIFVLTIAAIAYLPWWQNGLGETIVQGYWMHQGVGMWFMMFTLGIVYYFLPQQLNKPIYSYSLGILAFWTQILFYTTIGTHHFLFSAIPWWLQTFAIIGSMGMVIPVAAGTTNFLMTFKGAWNKVSSSYTLPFFLVGIVFYFSGSLQGTAEAFRSLSRIWHFTDFTVAHSHLTMYGIISFFLWAAIYAVVPRLTGNEPPHATVGTHFWLALVGLILYTFPLMYGSTLKGLMWADGKPFIDGVVFMAPYWLWRAIGGTLMWISHGVFAYNMYKMIAGPQFSLTYKPAHGVL